MKLKKVFVGLLLIMTLFINSCAAFMTNSQETRKTDKIVEVGKYLISTEFNPQIDIVENDIKISLFSKNKYNLKQKIYLEGGKDFQWGWLFVDFPISVGIFSGIASAINNGTPAITLGLLPAVVYFIGSWVWGSSLIEKSKEENKESISRNEIIPNTPFSLEIGTKILNGVTDDMGIAFLKDVSIERKDVMFGDAYLEAIINNDNKLTKKIDVKIFSKLSYDKPITETIHKPKETKLYINNSQLNQESNIPTPALKIRGKYYALIVGINNYKSFNKLQTAVKDAYGVENVLKSFYGFETKLLTDEKATRKNIIIELNNFTKKLSSDDSLLIYYAGHGYFDKEADKSYWLPVDASSDENSEWIMSDSITSNLKKIPSKQILIVSDSCYSGTLSRGIMINSFKSEDFRINYLEKQMNKNARVLLSSGGNEPVADSGSEGHSVFAKVFIDSLKGIDKDYFTAEELFINYIKEKVAGKSEQTPQYNIIRNSGHDDGDFIFIKKVNK